MSDPHRAGAAALFQKPIEDVTLKERRQFKALYFNHLGPSPEPSSTEEAVKAAERFGTTMAPTISVAPTPALQGLDIRAFVALSKHVEELLENPDGMIPIQWHTVVLYLQLIEAKHP